ncbi:MAG TPA: glycosyl hydrolase [Lapillicoccus sp.]|uniref:glycosyl hydrolase n=1 Tax=Lapillicoccus sp. TaxID=1909287 RepID=UPI002F95E41D
MTLDDLWEGFRTPPDEARPRAWWHWMDGNVDPAGIRLDLEWLHRTGVRGVQMFDGGMGTPQVVPERVRHGSAEWQDAVRLAAGLAEQLGLEFAVATSAGWSAAGAPWVEPADAMKKVVWSETVLEGGRAVEQQLVPLPDVAGPYQDCPRWGADARAHRFAWDWVAVAVPDDDVPIRLAPSSVTASAAVQDWTPLVDGSFASSVSLPRDPDGRSSAWIEQVFDAPVTVAAVTVGFPGPRGFGAAPAPRAVLEASDDGVAYRVVADLALPDAPAAGAVPVRTVAFPPVTARRFRLGLTGDSAEAALPRLAAGVRVPPILRRVSEFLVSEFALFAGGRVHQAELKAGFAAAPDYYALDADPASATSAIDPAQVIDVTAHVDEHGRLRWTAPAGAWRVLRFGMSLTGQTNGPAAAEATGLEVDKLDGTRVRHYLDTYLALFDGASLDALLSDSIESGPQNATDLLRERFIELRRYDPMPWLPALAGYLVGDASRTDRFLWDHRRTISDLVAAEYYGTLEAEAHARGLTYYAEALEDHRPQLGDDLAMRSHADVPMGALWMFDAGSEEPAPTYLADLKGASSVAHVHGKAFTGAESMTALHRPWSYTPRRLKHVADLELALGVTRFCIHTSPHQPTQVPPPGIGLAPVLGQAFIRSEPWADLARPWIDYLARCSWLLNQGTPAVDIAVFIGEEGPVTALFGDQPDRAVPTGFDFDYLDLDALETRFSVSGGSLAAGDVSYRLLYLGGSSSRMTVRALGALVALVDAGATVAGHRPTGSPSLADDDAEHAELCDRLWGAGRVRDTDDLAAVLSELGVRRTLVVDGPEVLRIGRRTAVGELHFVANPSPEPVSLGLSTPDGQPLIAWDPVTLRRAALSDTGTGHRLDLPALGSVFLLPGGHADEARSTVAERHLDGTWRLALPGVLDDELPAGPVPWTDLGGKAAGFAGTGTYTTEVDVEHRLLEGHAVVLELSDVGDVARVRINGVEQGIVWTAPWQLEVTGSLRAGRNLIEVSVANAWMNRLIAEAASPTGEIFGPVAEVYAPDAPLHAAGLSGPVQLRILR